jgi:ATP-dependent Clp protease ATP-binding subunit ClpB
VYGARPLKRFIQRQLETKVARTLIAGDVLEGTRVVVDLIAGELTVTVEKLK